jgi:hypothetical protein
MLCSSRPRASRASPAWLDVYAAGRVQAPVGWPGAKLIPHEYVAQMPGLGGAPNGVPVEPWVGLAIGDGSDVRQYCDPELNQSVQQHGWRVSGVADRVDWSGVTGHSDPSGFLALRALPGVAHEFLWK